MTINCPASYLQVLTTFLEFSTSTQVQNFQTTMDVNCLLFIAILALVATTTLQAPTSAEPDQDCPNPVSGQESELTTETVTEPATATTTIKENRSRPTMSAEEELTKLKEFLKALQRHVDINGRPRYG